MSDPYADLDRLPFLHPMLQTVKSFEKGLVASFGDKFAADTAKRALEECVQGNRTVAEYNAHYQSLCHLVVDSERAMIDKYVEGLNDDIVDQAMSEAWLTTPNLATKMSLALSAAVQLENLLRRKQKKKGKHSQSSSYPVHHPATHFYQHSNTSTPVRSPDAMDIDAASTFRAPKTPEQKFEALFRTVCMAQRVCFRCLQRTSPPDHINAYNCPNMGVSGAARKKFVEQYQNAVPRQVAEVLFGIQPPGESSV